MVIAPEVGIPDFYDSQVARKVRDFVDGNARAERAWATVEKWAPNGPRRIVDVGCGIGTLAWRMARKWPHSRVTGVDLSPRAIEVAVRLFGGSHLEFMAGSLQQVRPGGGADLVTLVDVYEHVDANDRDSFHASLRALLAPGGRVIMAVPTPRHLAWLRVHEPSEIQPVDEDITVDVVQACAQALGLSLVYYCEQSVWLTGDYAHAVLAAEPTLEQVPGARGAAAFVRKATRRLMAGQLPHRAERSRMVRKRLGRQYDGLR